MENNTAPQESLRNLTGIVYLLQILGFFTGIAFIAAVIINYIKRDEVKGSWLESHFDWQIKTFWVSLLVAIIGVLLTFVFIGVLILIGNAIWVIYRIIKGGLKYLDNQPVA